MALSNLQKERCLCVPAPSHQRRNLVSRNRTEFGALEMVDPTKIEDALDSIAWSINEHSGYSDARWRILRDDYLSIDLSFDLTDYGERLLAACEPIDPSARPD